MFHQHAFVILLWGMFMFPLIIGCHSVNEGWSSIHEFKVSLVRGICHTPLLSPYDKVWQTYDQENSNILWLH